LSDVIRGDEQKDEPMKIKRKVFVRKGRMHVHVGKLASRENRVRLGEHTSQPDWRPYVSKQNTAIFLTTLTKTR